jgi:hypothetical protein
MEQTLVNEKSIHELMNIIHQKDLEIKKLEQKNEKLINKLMQISQVADLRDYFKEGK